MKRGPYKRRVKLVQPEFGRDCADCEDYTEGSLKIVYSGFALIVIVSVIIYLVVRLYV